VDVLRAVSEALPDVERESACVRRGDDAVGPVAAFRREIYAEHSRWISTPQRALHRIRRIQTRGNVERVLVRR